ncbi:hypothetical protein IFM89_013563 [Coptis chinensis]|uniref:RRM domain-containing protein n=1 Tax=Coptis chinensis TaxID=261450 RepID=A0A835LUY9_9MAGN|nr:hypothetical protein IFM89_013563 [Coptis chinensis]
MQATPAENLKVLYLQYAKLEEDYGLAKRAMKVYDQAAKTIPDNEKMSMYEIYIARAAEIFGVPKTREIYECFLYFLQQAIESGLPDKDVKVMCMKYAELEKSLGEIDRARAIYNFSSQYADPRSDADFWTKWHDFEVQHGNEDTFREMLRMKRSVSASYSQVCLYSIWICNVNETEICYDDLIGSDGEDGDKIEIAHKDVPAMCLATWWYASSGASAQKVQCDEYFINTTIYVGGLDPSVSLEDLRQTFPRYGETTSVRIPGGKGFGFVKFANRRRAPALVDVDILRVSVHETGSLLKRKVVVDDDRVAKAARLEGIIKGESDHRSDGKKAGCSEGGSSSRVRSFQRVDLGDDDLNPLKKVKGSTAITVIPPARREKSSGKGSAKAGLGRSGENGYGRGAGRSK